MKKTNQLRNNKLITYYNFKIRIVGRCVEENKITQIIDFHQERYLEKPILIPFHLLIEISLFNKKKIQLNALSVEIRNIDLWNLFSNK